MDIKRNVEGPDVVELLADKWNLTVGYEIALYHSIC